MTIGWPIGHIAPPIHCNVDQQSPNKRLTPMLLVRKAFYCLFYCCTYTWEGCQIWLKLRIFIHQKSTVCPNVVLSDHTWRWLCNNSQNIRTQGTFPSVTEAFETGRYKTFMMTLQPQDFLSADLRILQQGNKWRHFSKDDLVYRAGRLYGWCRQTNIRTPRLCNFSKPLNWTLWNSNQPILWAT